MAQGQYRDFVQERGYSVDRAGKVGAATNPWSIEFSKSQSPRNIDEETEVLRNAATQLGGSYDGWGTEVVGSN